MSKCLSGLQTAFTVHKNVLNDHSEFNAHLFLQYSDIKGTLFHIWPADDALTSGLDAVQQINLPYP